ncbi:peptidoglycan-binding domain-containing protein [Trueperella sp. LYQ141]|uniref:peptidoglycan-binding domain-containing protein n=1 Tax=Trueperella sp. LYQ141 TaxID=3391058 RepID=UPI003982D86F
MSKSALFLRILGALLALGVVFGAGWWAGSATFGSRSTDPEVAPPTYAEARQGHVGREYSFGITARLPMAPVAVNLLEGVVTAIGSPDVAQGSLLYRVAQTPVIAVRSQLPFYRDLSEGARGDDVHALQQMLVDCGLLAGADGVFGAGTTHALKQLQLSRGGEATGVAPLGSLVAFSTLPTHISFSPDLRMATLITTGATVISAPSAQRDFIISANKQQVEFVPVGAEVVFNYGDASFNAVVSRVEPNTSGEGVVAYLSSSDGGSVCADRCDVLPTLPEVTMLGAVHPEKSVEGVVIPAAAVVTLSDGSTKVLMSDGEERQVTIRGSGQGLVVVEGVAVGEKVTLGVEVVSR